MRNAFALLGDLLYCPVPGNGEPVSAQYVVCEDGRVSGVFETLPSRFEGIEVVDYTGMLIVPGFTDLHLHAPQYPNCGLGGDLELLDWLQAYTYPEEARYADLDYARGAYTQFAQALLGSVTTRACIFATLHSEASLLLGDLLERTGLKTQIGRVSMDRNSPDPLRERDAPTALAEERAWLEAVARRGWRNTVPVITPRFVPACSQELLLGLGQLRTETGLAVQSHLDENPSEIEWVRELVPDAPHYAGAYDRFGLFGGGYPAIMAHCVHCSEEELALIAVRGVTVAHCPTSNT
ncbi:MAG: amidohydrolase family protein, partial [Oscillospiraceae bacterium]